MRGFLQPSYRPTPTEGQAFFQALSRGRRTKLATASQTTLIKADQWARGEGVATDVSEALDRAVKGLQAKKKK
jgi:hypothetical protein